MATTTATSSAKPTVKVKTDNYQQELIRVLLPYGLAILAQILMVLLYFYQLWEKPHYQFFPFAIIATIALAAIRWPYDEPMPFHRSLISDILLVLAGGAALMGVLFVVPWFAAASVVLLITSLLTRTIDPETKKSLWPCALPLLVCLSLPFDMDSVVITRLQAYSAHFTSQLLDLVGLGHYMDGVVINVPDGSKYGVEEACSGVVSFFTLIAITSAFIVWARRITTPHRVIAGMLIGTGLLIGMIEWAAIGFGYFTLGGIVLILLGGLGFRSTLLLLSAVFWALFMNTVRIFVIPIAEVQMGFQLAEGMAHAMLGYVVLIFGVLLVLSTDQFLTFLFGPVEAASEEAPGIQRSIVKFWNGFLAGKTDEEGAKRRTKNQSVRKPITSVGRTVIWVLAGIMILCGLYESWDVKQSWAHPELAVRFFDADVTVDFVEGDLPKQVGDNWTKVSYQNDDRHRGSDLGQRSDVWQFQSPRCLAHASFDQTFPGWHELTTCYKNQGWKLVSREWHKPEVADGEEPWEFIEARFEKQTGEKGYLLFSHFDAFGNPVAAPEKWGTLNSLFIRARNRLSNRVRATLFDGAVYQTQVFLYSFNDFDDETKQEAQDRYLKVREIFRQRFVEKRAAESNGSAEANTESTTEPKPAP